MTTYTCDKCGMEVTFSSSYKFGRMYGPHHITLCASCFMPYLERMETDNIAPPSLRSLVEEHLKALSEQQTLKNH